MKAVFLAPMVFAASLFAAVPAVAETLAYPGPDNASFMVDHPANWEVAPGEEVGDYVTLTGPTGVNLQLRTIPGTESAMGGRDRRKRHLPPGDLQRGQVE